MSRPAGSAAKPSADFTITGARRPVPTRVARELSSAATCDPYEALRPRRPRLPIPPDRAASRSRIPSDRPATWSACRTPCRSTSDPETPWRSGPHSRRGMSTPISRARPCGFCGSRVSIFTATTSKLGRPSLLSSASRAGISLPAGHAPGGPEIEQYGPAAPIRERLSAAPVAVGEGLDAASRRACAATWTAATSPWASGARRAPWPRPHGRRHRSALRCS